MVALIMLAIASYLARRTARRSAAASGSGRSPQMVLPFACRGRDNRGTGGSARSSLWLLIDPRLEGVIPFWVVALCLGFLAFPRPRAR